ncbi:hybrid nucleoside-diphosphate sugar epimerase/sugar transferase [Sulfitobacter sp. M220]|uniref:hybrid nucleoside-diphosphate sugar epimerase/sugar transferase n=1 Tax=Sulfitobacter sp. M220 TaxID=2675333 RepID=UPI001F409F75|nr:hybrid nucleoside-diphosphate sugar epimerase/sugar transferase [Sulfitobacter sp. M220]
MKIVITGASGYVGQNIVPILKDQCEALLLVGRDGAKLARMFPDMPNCSFEEMPIHALDFDVIIHLSVLNNKAPVSDADFHDVNVTLTAETANAAAACGIKKFYNISSVHVLDDQNMSQYAKSKREAVSRLVEVSGIEVTNVYLPFVRGAEWNGKLAFLNSMPLFLAKPLQASLLALKPSVKAERLARFVMQSSVHQDIVILSEGQSNNPAYKVMKRGMDLLFAVAVIALLWWALLIIWAFVRFGSPGPGIFAQERVGLHGEIFTCYKFRTMQQGTVQTGTHEVSQASVTPIGRFLRGTKLDELPQVWNILKNEISLIGPRPGLPVQKKLFEERQARGVFDVKPGISGLAQINDVDMSDPIKLAIWDAQYIALQSFILDLKISLATVQGGGQGDKTSI